MASDPSRQAVGTVRLRSRLRSLAIEGGAGAVVVFATFIVLAHVVESSWLHPFLYDSDSLVLPLVEKSIQRGEPFEWVFSSQSFLFPEGLFFFISTVFTDSARVALIVNACLNILALYALLRTIAHLLAHHSRHRFVEITISIAATALFLVYVLLEPTGSVNFSGIATLYLTTTYYYGVVIVGLAIIALVLWVTRLFGSDVLAPKRVGIYAVTTAVLVALTFFSDPLFLVQVCAPLTVALVLLALMKRLSWRGLATLLIPGVAGLIAGLLLRRVFREMFANSVGSYLSPSRIPESLQVLGHSVEEMLSTAEGSFKFLMMAAVLLFTWVLLAFAVVAQSRSRLSGLISNAEVFILAFVTVSSISLLAGNVLTGTTTTRYLGPLFSFPLLTVVSVGVYVLRRLLLEVENAELRRNLSRFLVGVAATASALIVLVGATSLPAVVAAAEGKGYTREDCFNDFVGEDDVNGVGSFWTVRALDLYGMSEGEVLQATSYLDVYGWMINLASYEGKDFSYVVTDDSGQIPDEALDVLGEPSKVVDCGDYRIYDYRGTRGEVRLTDSIAESLESLRES